MSEKKLQRLFLFETGDADRVAPNETEVWTTLGPARASRPPKRRRHFFRVDLHTSKIFTQRKHACRNLAELS